jgi:hypothetical protein
MPSRYNKGGDNPAAVIARDMRALPDEARKAVRPALRRAGQVVAREAMVNASWSSRIPGTIRVVTSFRVNREGVTIRAGGKNAPHARPYEHLGDPGTFRHPVYGDREVWVAQSARPFLFKAAKSTVGTVTDMIAETMDDVSQSLGFS